VAERSVTHHRTGERITFLAEDPLVMQDEVPAGSDRGPAHAHPSQEERFEVLSGEYELFVDGEEARVLRPGDSAVVAAGTPHSGCSAEGAVLRITLTPALRWEKFVSRLFAGEPGARLLLEFEECIRVVR
jgi:mannose-6-phosphate isomerase-like protein (cupin superfamily)